MERKPLKGILSLVPTVFDEQGNLDLKGFRNNLRYLEKEGMHGIVAMASTGQYYELNDEEFRKVALSAREECHNMACVIGTNFQDTRTCVARTRYAEEIGADGVFIIPPYYSNWLDAESCYSHYKTVYEATKDIQFMIYNYEASGFIMDINLCDRLLKNCDRVVATKECTPLLEMGELSRRHGQELNIMSGAETGLYPNMVMGGKGSVAIFGTAYPKFMLAFYDACVNKRWPEALRYHRLVNEYFEATDNGGYHFDNKGVATAAGLYGGYQRPPFESPDERDIRHHQMWLKKFDEAISH